MRRRMARQGPADRQTRPPCRRPNFSTLCRHTGALRPRPAKVAADGEHAAIPGYAHVRRISRRRFLQTLGLSSAGVVGLSGYGLAVEPVRRLEVTRYRVSPTHWPHGLALSIAVIADVHAGGPAMPVERIRGIVAQTNALNPDVIVLLGDFAANHRFKTRAVAPEEWAQAMGELSA